MDKIGNGLGAGLCAGSAVGAIEALYVLQSAAPSEYQAFGYAWTLYGLAGGVVGSLVGVLLTLLARRTSPATAWTLAFSAVVGPLGYLIGHETLDKVVYAEQGVPRDVAVGLAGGLGFVCLLGTWLGGNLLEKTPLRVLMSFKGASVGWGGGFLLAWIFALSPAPGAVGNIAPREVQGPEFASRPNVILIMVDSLRADALGAYGASPEATPVLDRFATDAVVFEQFVTSASWTRSSTASLFSSLAPSSHSCEHKSSVLSPGVTTLAEQLGEAGYATGGLPNNANITAAVGFGQGFDWYPYTPSYPLWASESSYALSLYQLLRTRVYARLVTERRVEDYYAPVEVQIERAKQWLDANSGQKNLMFLHLMEPHDPYFRHPYDGEAVGRVENPSPTEGDGHRLRDLYAGEVRWVDDALGGFFNDLRARGLYDDAAIIVTADHGEEFFDHGGWWHGTTLYDEQVHVPLIVKLPGSQYAGTRVPWQVRQVDVAPTVAAIASVDKHPTWQGDDLFTDTFDADLALGRPPPPPEPDIDPATGELRLPVVEPWTAPTWANHPASRDALSEQDFEGYDLQALRRGGRKIIEAVHVPPGNARQQPPVQFFDLLADPHERVNLAGSGTGEEAALRAAVESMVEERKAKSVDATARAADEAEKCRLCTLGYLNGAECSTCPSSGN